MKRFIFYFLLFLNVSACATESANLPSISPAMQLTVIENSDGVERDKANYYFSPTIAATGQRVFIFDPNHNSWAAYDERGLRVNAGKASGGSTYCPDLGRSCKTISGNFKIHAKRGANCRSSLYPLSTGGGAPMPYCMLFASGGYAIHGSNYVPDHNASHGCIRIRTTAAKWLHEEFLALGSNVVVLPYHSVEKLMAKN